VFCLFSLYNCDILLLIIVSLLCVNKYYCIVTITALLVICIHLRVLSPFRGGGIAYLNDPDNYAGWSFYTPGGASQARQIEG